jgi:hypothetical protein
LNVRPLHSEFIAHNVSNSRNPPKPGAPAVVLVVVDGVQVVNVDVARTVPGAFTASETLDVGTDLGSPVSLAYFDRSPFAFDGKISGVSVDLK